MQHLTDLNYSEVTNFDEDDFILPGPGCLRGIQKCFAFGRLPTVAEAVNLIEACVEEQEEFFKHFGLEPVTLFGRRLHLIDCQNLFCETDKYARKAHPEYNLDPSEKKTRIKNLFRLTGSPPGHSFRRSGGWNNRSLSGIPSAPSASNDHCHRLGLFYGEITRNEIMDADKIDAAIDFLTTSTAELIKFVIKNPSDYREKSEFIDKYNEAMLVFEHFEKMDDALTELTVEQRRALRENIKPFMLLYQSWKKDDP
jgi:alpha-glutamyl/putrescinyl thymine pyrophosphorylase clade 1